MLGLGLGLGLELMGLRLMELRLDEMGIRSGEGGGEGRWGCGCEDGGDGYNALWLHNLEDRGNDCNALLFLKSTYMDGIDTSNRLSRESTDSCSNFTHHFERLF